MLSIISMILSIVIRIPSIILSVISIILSIISRIPSIALSIISIQLSIISRVLASNTSKQQASIVFYRTWTITSK